MEINEIIKRDYDTTNFVLDKITNAIEKAMLSVDHGDRNDANSITNIVLGTLLERKQKDCNYIPTVEEVQDIVELKLM